MGLIMASHVSFPVGKPTPPVPFRDSVNHLMEDQPFFILREATHQEWEQSVRDGGGDPSDWFNDPSPYYYEVTTD